jgi:hypothetical protein
MEPKTDPRAINSPYKSAGSFLVPEFRLCRERPHRPMMCHMRRMASCYRYCMLNRLEYPHPGRPFATADTTGRNRIHPHLLSSAVDRERMRTRDRAPRARVGGMLRTVTALLPNGTPSRIERQPLRDALRSARRPPNCNGQQRSRDGDAEPRHRRQLPPPAGLFPERHFPN